MIKVDISNIWGELSLTDLLSIEAEISAAHSAVMEGTGAGSEYLGWLELPDRAPTAEHMRILAAGQRIRENSDVLVVVGIAFILVERWNAKRTPRVTDIDALTFKQALGIGIFQLISAILPGTSRSGSTILGGLMLGVNRTVAAEFTFFLGIPVMFGASLLKLVKFGFAFTTAEIVVLIVGMVSAFAVSMVCIRFLMDFIKRHDFAVFGWYRIVLGAVMLVYFAVRAM